MRAVAQNSHAIAHPAWLDRHSVTRAPAGMITLSIASPSPSATSSLRVPSKERATAAEGIELILK